MSQYSHKEFISTLAPPTQHERHSISRPAPQFNRIVLRSIDRDAGSTRHNAFFSGVSINERLSAPAVLIVNSFNLENGDSGAWSNTVLELRLRGITQSRSWDSSNKTATDLLCAFQGYNYQNQGASSDAIGLAVTNPNQFQNANLNVYFTSADDNSFTSDFAGEWTLVLDIVSYDDSLAY